MENQESTSKSKVNWPGIIIGVVASMIMYHLYQFMWAFDGIRAFSGKQPIFWPLYEIVPWIPILAVTGLCLVGIGSLFGRVAK